MSDLAAPVTGLVIAVFVLVFLVLRTKIHVVIAMIAAACIAGLAGGMSVESTISSITGGFGSTLGSIGIVIGLGVMMGRILEVSGAASQIADSFLRLLGRRKEPFALALTGYFVSIPIFVDSAFIILIPMVRALAITSGRSILTLGVALAGGLVVTHTTVPPTPGPLGAAGIFGVDVGAMMLMGMILAVPCVSAIVFYAMWLGKKYPDFGLNPVVDQPQDLAEHHVKEQPRPGVFLSWLPIFIPIVLIFSKASMNFVWPSNPEDTSGATGFRAAIDFFGSPIVALSVSTALATYSLIPWMDRRKTSSMLEEGLHSAGIILLVTGAGGALGAVVRESGAGVALASYISVMPISPVMIPFFVATTVRLIQGSGTVACITSASITAPILSGIPDMNMLIAAQSAVMGALCFSYFNDSLFWVVNRMMGVTDVKEQIMVWSIPTTIAWGVGGVSVAIVNLLFGSRGTLLDPLLPMLMLAGILLFLRRRRPTNSVVTNSHR